MTRTDINHHIPDALLVSYASGRLEHGFALAVATHVSMCDACRATLGAHQEVGGALLEESSEQPVSADLKSAVMAKLDQMPPDPAPRGASGVFPGPVMEALKGQPPRWKPLGMGVRQSILHDGRDGSVRLLFIPPGQAMPDHGHNGMEMTLVLQGAFHDETGKFGIGDMEIADEHVEHTPIADMQEPCICLAATNAPLRFNSLIPRMVQRFFRI